jgi:hypothetical protein
MPSKTSTQKLPHVPDHRFKELLLQVELAGGRHKLKSRQGLDTLKSICNRNKSFFGEVGSLERRAIQQRFNNQCARKPIKKYIQLLQDFDITPAVGTTLLYQQALDHHCAGEDSEDFDDDEDTSNTNDITEDDENTTTTTDETENTTTTEAEFDAEPAIQPTMFSSPPAKKPVARLPPQVSSPFPVMSTFDIEDLLPSINNAFITIKKNGTKMRPHCICVDTNCPENNREFEIHHVHGLESESGYSHDGFEISVIVPPPDYQDWEAKVVDVPGFHKRAVLIRGLSGGYFLRDPILTNKYLQVCPHQATVAAVKTHQLELLDQDDSKYEYWLCLFPPTIELDQRLLAKISTKEDSLLKHVAGLEKEECPVTMKPLVGCRVTFTIAQTTGRRRIADVSATEEIQWT